MERTFAGSLGNPRLTPESVRAKRHGAAEGGVGVGAGVVGVEGVLGDVGVVDGVEAPPHAATRRPRATSKKRIFKVAYCNTTILDVTRRTIDRLTFDDAQVAPSQVEGREEGDGEPRLHELEPADLLAAAGGSAASSSVSHWDRTRLGFRVDRLSVEPQTKVSLRTHGSHSAP